MRRACAVLIALITGIGAASPMMPMSAAHLSSGVSSGSVNCAATTLSLHPPAGRSSVTVAHDSPRGHFTVSLPLYPGASPLKKFPASPFFQLDDDPYVHTAGAEFTVASGMGDVMAWFNTHIPPCGWKSNGPWSGNMRVFPSGDIFVSRTNPDLTLQVSFGSGRHGGTYIGYGVEEEILPARPLSSYLRGQFSLVRIALQYGAVKKLGEKPPMIYATVRSPATIARLVKSINTLRGYRTEYAVCFGIFQNGLRFQSAWLSFVRPNGAAIHAYSKGPGGPCGGGLAVSGTHWLMDGGAVWYQIVALAKHS